MREHMGLFRGKRIDNGEWVEGNLVNYNPHFEWVHITYFAEDDGGFLTRFEAEVIPDTIGECTGLKDKNGKLIFEGDIVVYDNTPYNAYGHRVTGVIVWRKWAWRCRYTEYGSIYHYSVGAEDFFGAKSKIIGNIHDNPELLKGGEG